MDLITNLIHAASLAGEKRKDPAGLRLAGPSERFYLIR